MWLPKEDLNNEDSSRYSNEKEEISQGPKPSEKLWSNNDY